MASTPSIKVFGLCGSLRRGSLNAAALRAARELAPPGMEIGIFEGLREIPPYDDDLRQQGYPPPVQALRDAIKSADAVLIATPEYNYSVPGVLKNAIDWASRPPEQPFDGKPVAIMGASPGAIGTARAQYHLRQSFVFLNAFVLNRPEVMIGQATSRFDAEGRLTDEKTRDFVQSMLVALKDWTERLRR
ncbi:MAG: NADPH-dependent FMN reductase [Paracraurococcus sp.]|jgi:chromate reductase, NAD(P)H dehydrogenase (quinone)